VSCGDFLKKKIEIEAIMDGKADIFPRFSDEEYARRYAAVRREMAARGLDALIVVGDSGGRTANQANVYWLTNWLDPMVAYVIMTPTGGPWLLMSNPLYLHTALRAAYAADIRACTGINPGPEVAARLSDAGLSSGRIGIAGVRNVGRASMPSEHLEALKKALPQIEPPRVDLPGAMIKRELGPVTFQENMLIVVQPHVVTADGKRGLQAGGLVVIEKNGARALQKYPMQFVRVA